MANLKRNEKSSRSIALRLAAARARSTGKKPTPYAREIKPPELAPGVVPKGNSAPVMALDANPYTFAAGGAMGSVGGFPGFQYLAQLATRPEYRAFASTISTELTRKWIEFTSKQDDDTDSADKIKAIEAEFVRLNVRSAIQNAAADESFFGRGQIFIGLRGHDIKTPLILDPATVAKGSLERVTNVEAVWTTPSHYDALNPASPAFYKPTSWFMLGQEVHASRLMTVITRPLPDILKPAYNFAGLSMSQLAEPYVDNWLRTRQAVADLIDNFSITALKTSMDQVLQGGADDDGEAAQDLFDRADLFTLTRSNRGLMLLDKEREDLAQLNVPLSGLHELQAQSQEHMCLSKGTLVLTRRGWIEIESVNNCDEVLTRNGYAPVEWSGVTNHTNTFVEFDLGFTKLRVTEDHPIWSIKKQDFVNARNVDVSHHLLKSREWVFTDNPSLGEDACGATPNQITTGILKRAACSIGSFGKLTLVKFRHTWTFITKMGTDAITGSKTWNYCHARNIPQSIRLEDGGNLSSNLSKNFASSAGKVITLPCHIWQNIAQMVARRKLTVCVKSVNKITLNSTEPVFNLKVKDGYLPEFYANGVLVHNCSVSRIPAIVLTGISPSGLNATSEGEIRVFYDWIAAQQEAFWRDPIDAILKVVQLSLFGEIDEDIGFNFVPLYQMTPKELSEIREADARTADTYVAMGAVGAEEVRDRLAKDPNSGYQGLESSPDLEPYDPAGEAIDASVSEKQHRAMEAAAHGKSTLGIPESVGKEFVSKDDENP